MIYGQKQSNFHSTKRKKKKQTQNMLFEIRNFGINMFWNKHAYKEKSAVSF